MIKTKAVKELEKKFKELDEKFDRLDWTIKNPQKFKYGDKVKVRFMIPDSFGQDTDELMDEFNGIVLDNGTLIKDYSPRYNLYLRLYNVSSDKHKGIISSYERNISFE